MAAELSGQAEYHAGLWDQFKDLVFSRLETVEQAAAALRRGTLGDDLRRQAEVEAHRLAGSLGSIGFPDGSRIAREIEGLLREENPLAGPQAVRLSDLAAALRQTLDRPPI